MKNKTIENIIQTLKKKDVDQIRSISQGTSDPRPLAYKWSRSSYKPEVVSINNGKKDLYAVENKINKKNISDLISKWILFGLEARKNGGNFYLFVPEKQVDYCQEIINEKRLSAKVMAAMS